MHHLKDEGLIEGWRDELYPITSAFDTQPLAVVERAAAVYLGIKSYGVHLNGYVLLMLVFFTVFVMVFVFVMMLVFLMVSLYG